jgi:ribosomal-protein-alanine N-acetyltransferase
MPTSVLSSAPPRATIPKLDELDLVLATPRLRLRPFAETDVDDLWPHVSDPALTTMLSWAAHTERDQTLDFIRRVNAGLFDGTCAAWAIEVDGRASGCISLESIQFGLRAWRLDRAELGYWMAPPLWGRGLMTEAAHAVVRCGFELIGLHKVTVGCIAENAGSRRVIEKLGFRPVGRLEDDVWRDGCWWSVLRYELTASEWSDVSTTMRVSRPRLP